VSLHAGWSALVSSAARRLGYNIQLTPGSGLVIGVEADI